MILVSPLNTLFNALAFEQLAQRHIETQTALEIIPWNILCQFNCEIWNILQVFKKVSAGTFYLISNSVIIFTDGIPKDQGR